MNQPPDPFEFLKSLWGPMGLPLPGSMGRGLDPGEIDRRIAELKSVENWLNMNLNVLRTAVHGLEMQKSGLAAMQEVTHAAQAQVAPAGRDPAAAPPDAASKAPQQQTRPGPGEPSEK